MENRIPDRNLEIESKIGEADAVFYDVRKPPFAVYGLYRYREEPQFCRMPEAVASRVSDGVHQLASNTAGGRVRFSTDSRYVAIRAEMPYMCMVSHMPFGASAGFDLYIDDPETGNSCFWKALRPDCDAKNGFESKVVFPDRKLRYITLNFPSYSDVKNLFVAVQSDAVLGEGMPYRPGLPIVYYGSSITQGACASRPGNAYENIISRKTNTDFINLGFSGNAKGEDEMIDYLASLPMSVFVCDYDHNQKTAGLQATHRKLYETVRAKHPDLPYLMLTRTDHISSDYPMIIKNRDVVYDTYRFARESGDGKVWYLDGNGIFRGAYEDCCTVDGTHPNDYGFVRMADAIGSVLQQMGMWKHF